MGKKYEAGALGSSWVVRSRLKFIIPASILLVFVVLNSSSLSPFDVASNGPVSYTVLSDQDHHNIRDGRHEMSRADAEAIAAQYENLRSRSPSQIKPDGTDEETVARVSPTEDPPLGKTEVTQDEEEEEEMPFQSVPAIVEPEATEDAPDQTEDLEAEVRVGKSDEIPVATEKVEETPAQTEDLESEVPVREFDEIPVEETPDQTEAPVVVEDSDELTHETPENSGVKKVEETPAQTEASGEASPAAKHKHKRRQETQAEEAPVHSEEKVETPVRTEEKVETPVRAEENVETPVRTEEKVGTPVRTEEKVETPVRTEEKVKTPVRTEEKVETPVRTEEKVVTPVRTEIEAPANGQVGLSQTELSNSENAKLEVTRNPENGKTEEEEDSTPVVKVREEEAELPPVVEETSAEGDSAIEPELLPLIMGDKKNLAGTDKWKLGPLGSDLKYFEEKIRNTMLPYTTRKSSNEPDTCDGKRVYVYNLPPEFNQDLVARCEMLFRFFSMCPYVTDSGRGVPVNAVDNGTQIFVPGNKWFNTHQYALEMISHARILKYKCLTEDRSKADMFYIPYYAGFDVIEWHFNPEATNEKKDALSLKLVSWLGKQKEFVAKQGKDHLLVLGKISWDFRRHPDIDWGSRMLRFPELADVTRLLIERDPWCDRDIGVPHPTYFHPTSAADIDSWLGHISSQKREYMVTFVGKERKNDPKNPRTALVHQCINVTSSEDCKFVECNKSVCLHPAYVTRAFLNTHFCMQPSGDSPTRRSVFDSLIAGCIPVLFHPQTAYTQYPWHLPRNESLYSVFIPEEDVIAGTVNVIDELKKISVEQRNAMRDYIIHTMVPGLIYSAPGADVSPYRDAFDISMDQALHRVKLKLGLSDQSQ